ncbi:hypothetical protein GCM10025751_02370 [Haladaptatus pallidirubidus]|uniref:Transposase n=1 Tax=Haladaptatus pallidirubidus TaxID=1008152 RepID=A0AAV3UAU7_9EURY
MDYHEVDADDFGSASSKESRKIPLVAGVRICQDGTLGHSTVTALLRRYETAGTKLGGTPDYYSPPAKPKTSVQ